MSEYEPGTVALIRVSRDYPTPELGIRDSIGKWYVAGPRLGSKHGWYEDHIEIVRPLVVIDPEDADALDRLTKALVEAAEKHGNVVVSNNGIHPETTALALREFANPTPPRPAEPQGLGAVVEDTEGVRWIRTDLPGESEFNKPWQSGPIHAHWQGVRAVKVLSEGVTS